MTSEANTDLALSSNLNPEQEQKIQELSSKIDEKNDSILTYGAETQKQLSVFSQNMLAKVQSQDTGAVGQELSNLMVKLNEANPDELRAENNNIFRKIFGHVKRSIYEATAKYQKIGAQIDTIANRLDSTKDGLINDNKTLNDLYIQNKNYFDDLNIYIEAAKLKTNELRTTTIPNLKADAEKSNDQMAIQKIKDLEDFTSRLEKRTYDLEIARQISIQQAPQIRMIQNTNQVLAEKIQSSIDTAIPLWKNQVAIALTLLRQKDAVTSQRQVSETTNDLLKKNSEMLKMSSIETAKENERGVVDIETLTQTQNDLVDTLKEVLQIQQSARIQRKDAEDKLQKLELGLRDSLLEYTKDKIN
jgi:uncharacterized protein YaaN involved in tellurite resistance